MSLGTEQRRFTLMLAKFIEYAYAQGYEIALGDVFRVPRVHGHIGEKVASYGHRNSCHKLKLAADCNLFRDGVYLKGEAAKEAHNFLHDEWDRMGGGPRIRHDLNHYSIEYKGMR